MARVEWMALNGEQVETLLANLVYNSDGRALRIRPSQGDYGIDIILPAKSDSEKWDVYQVKKFAQNLSSGQKTQIVNSFARSLVGMLRRGVPLNDWYLALPLDPTVENYLDWFKTVPDQAIKKLAGTRGLDPPLTKQEIERIRTWLEAPDRVIGWKGLDFCEGLAAGYPYVVDYYLHGGAQRIKDAVSDVAKLLQRDITLRDKEAGSETGHGSAALVQPGELRDHLLRLDRVLDTDPHFRYGHSLDLHAPALHPEPGLVAATQESIPGDRWLTFKIYARSAQSLEERPIPMRMEFDFEETSEEHQAFKDWVKYGKPFEAAATFGTDLPGGLQLKDASGRVRVSTSEGEETRFRNRQRVAAPDGTPLAELSFVVMSTSGASGKGTWARGTDDTETLISESMFDLMNQSHKVKFTLEPLAGLEAARALPVVTFASHLTGPNRLQVAAQYGPFLDVGPLPDGAQPLASPALVRIVRALTVIQSQTSAPVLIPDFSDFTPEEIQDLRRGAALIQGQTTIRTWTQFTFTRNPGALVAPGMHFEVLAGEELRLPRITGDQLLGLVELKIPSMTVRSVDEDQVTCVPFKEDTMYLTIVDRLPDAPPDQKVLSVRPIT